MGSWVETGTWERPFHGHNSAPGNRFSFQIFIDFSSPVSKWLRMIGLVVAFTILVLHNCEGSGKDKIPGIRMHDNYLFSESELYKSYDSEYKEEKVKIFSDITESRLSRVRRFDPNNRRLSILDRAKSRTHRKNLFGNRQASRLQTHSSQRNSFDRQRNNGITKDSNSVLGLIPSDDHKRTHQGSTPIQNIFYQKNFDKPVPETRVTCETLETENKILKDLLQQLQQQGKQSPVGVLNHLPGSTGKATSLTALDVLSQLQGQGHFNIQENDPLGILGNLSPIHSEEANRNFQGNAIQRVLVKPTPTLKTITETKSFLTSVTVNISKELEILFVGKTITTHVVEQEVQVETILSTEVRTIEVTPTPTWQTITVTPTVVSTSLPPAAPPGIPNFPSQNILLEQLQAQLGSQINTQDLSPILQQALLLSQQEQKSKPSRSNSINIGGIQPSPFSAPREEQIIRETELDSSLLSLPSSEYLVTQPTTSLSTIYKSGSVPGQFFSSVITVTLGGQDASSNPNKRVKRENVSEKTLFHGFKDLEYCGEETSTITVTKTVTKSECPER